MSSIKGATMSGTAREVSGSAWRSREDSPARSAATSPSIPRLAPEADLHFSSTAPSAPRTSPSNQPRRDPQSPQTKTVLLIEDDETSASALRAILTRRGCEVLVAGDMAGGISLLKHNPSSIVLDLIPPDGNGVKIPPQTRAGGDNHTRVIVPPAVPAPAILNEVRQLNPTALLRK